MKIAVISDTHFCVKDTPDGKWLKTIRFSQSLELGERLIQEVTAYQPDFLIHCGDITNSGTADEFDMGTRILNEAKYPWFAVRGNHDAREGVHQRMLERFGALSYSILLDGIRFLFLDVGNNTGGDYPNFTLTEEDKSFLQRELETAQNQNEKCVLVCHLPIFSGNHPEFSGMINGYRDPGNIRSMAEGKINAVLFGHWHVSELVVADNGTKLLYTGSGCEIPLQFHLIDTDKDFSIQCITIHE